MRANTHYTSYKDYMVKYDERTNTLSMMHESTGALASLVFDGLYLGEQRIFGVEEYDSVKARITLGRKVHELTITFVTEKDIPNGELHIYVDSKGITLKVYEIGHYAIQAKGHLVHGNSCDCIAINSKDTTTEVIRAALGPAASVHDDAIYNKLADSALVLSGCSDMELDYDWDVQKYSVTLRTMTEGVVEFIRFFVKKDLLRDKFNIDFTPRKNRGIYHTPPAGWMTWYAVKFGACEEAVLRNVNYQKEHLKAFGADTIWVDWEWCHRRYERERDDGVNNFNPDPEKYPNGLGPVAEEIKKAGFLPALWIGFTNDISMTEYEREHPEISLSHHETWSGLYYYDISHPEYLNGFLPKAVQQVKDWGYEAIKYDTLPNCITAHEQYHANMYNPEMTTYKAYRNMIQKTRELLGEDYYMLSCGGAEEVVLWGSGVFDAARVGPDLFGWGGFLTTIDRIRQYYPLHNIVLYNDPDNVVLREEYSTYAQAVSRIAIVSLLGLPLTFGDDLTKLPTERLDLLKRALPTMDVYPADFNNAVCDEKTQTIALNIALPFEKYLVAGIMNLTEESKVRDVSLRETLRLPQGEYLVYDYFREEFLGSYKDNILVSMAPYDTRVLSFRKKTGRPQVISTSRHITQGAAEIKSMSWLDATNTLTLTSMLVKDDPYIVTLYVPEGYTLHACNIEQWSMNGNILTVNILPTDNCEHELKLKFER